MKQKKPRISELIVATKHAEFSKCFTINLIEYMTVSFSSFSVFFARLFDVK